MDKESNDKLKGTLIVPAGLAIILVPFSMLIGWNLVTLILACADSGADNLFTDIGLE